MHIVEAWGTGLPRIMNRCKEYGLPEPLFEEFGDGFKVTMFRKVSSTPEKVSSAHEKVGSDTKKVSNAFNNKYLERLDAAGVTDKFKKNIEKVFDQSNSEPFGQTNIMEWLGCSKSKATNVMNAMKKAEIVVQINGLGVGKYKFTD